MEYLPKKISVGAEVCIFLYIQFLLIELINSFIHQIVNYKESVGIKIKRI